MLKTSFFSSVRPSFFTLFSRSSLLLLIKSLKFTVLSTLLGSLFLNPLPKKRANADPLSPCSSLELISNINSSNWSWDKDDPDFFNPVKGDVSDSQPNAGGGLFGPPLVINEGAPWAPILLKVILKPIKVMITCKILGPYLNNSARYRDLKNLSFWDFVLPWLTEIAITRSIFEIQGSYFGFIPLFMCSINHV